MTMMRELLLSTVAEVKVLPRLPLDPRCVTEKQREAISHLISRGIFGVRGAKDGSIFIIDELTKELVVDITEWVSVR